MTIMSHTRIATLFGNHRKPQDLSPSELREFNAAAERRYRAMTGMDQPLAEKAARAKRHAEKLPMTRKTW